MVLSDVISNELIDQIIEVHGKAVRDSLELNFENTYRVYNTLKMIGVEDIDSLLLNKVDLFFMDYNEFTSKLENKDIREVARLINEDFNNVDEIFYK